MGMAVAGRVSSASSLDIFIIFLKKVLTFLFTIDRLIRNVNNQWRFYRDTHRQNHIHRDQEISKPTTSQSTRDYTNYHRNNKG